MSKEDRTMWAKEVSRIENRLAHRRQMIKQYTEEISAMDGERDRLLDKIADDYAEENG